jgi:hypothetical protein
MRIFAVRPDKFPIKTISVFAATTPGRGARCSKAVKYRRILPVKIPVYMPVARFKSFDILSGLK